MNVSQVGLNSQYAKLDINNDNVINMHDYNAAKDDTIKNEILSYLGVTDDNSELDTVSKESTGKNKYGINKTDSKNFDSDVRNSKGTVYVVMGNLKGCGYCQNLESEIQKNASAIGNVAQVYDLDWNENNNLCWEIYEQGGGGSSVSFPQIAKFVDGKFVGLVDNPRNASAAVQSMISGTAGNGGTNSTNGTSSTASANSAKATSLNNEKTENTNKINELKTKINTNNDKIKSLEAQIATLSDEIKDEIKATNADVAALIEEKEAEYKKAVEEAIEEAKNQQVKDGEKPKTFSEIFANKLASNLNLSDDMLSAITATLSASSKAEQMDDLIGQVADLNAENASLEEQVKTLEDRNEAIDKEVSALNESGSGCCDPIGFKQGDAQYDFFVDKDNNGKLSNEKEFLGAEDQWKEMEALDTNKDGKVTKDEMEKGNLQMVKTENGKQTVVQVSEVFSDSDYIDLKSYKAAADGAVYNNNNKQQLLGNFNVNIGGQSIEGYNTMDDSNWLKANYNFSDAAQNSTTNNFFMNKGEDKTTAEYRKDLNDINSNIDKTFANISTSEDNFSDFMKDNESYGISESDFYFANVQSVMSNENDDKKVNKKVNK